MNVRNFLVGTQYIHSRAEYKNAILRGQASLLVMAAGALILITHSLLSLPMYGPLYVAMMLMATVSLWLNRKGFYTLSTVFLLTIVNLVVFIFDLRDVIADNNSGTSFFYVVVSMGSLVLFDAKEKILTGLFIIIPLGLYLLSHFTHLQVLAVSHLPLTLHKSDQTINFLVAFITCLLLIRLLIDNNTLAEKLLLANEQQLIRSKKRYELAIKGFRAGIWEWDIPANKVYCSPVWGTMLGYNDGEFELANFEQFMQVVYPDDRPTVTAAVQSHLRHRVPYLIEFRMLKKDNSIIWVLDSGLAVWDEQGNAIQMVGSATDITERKEAERKLHEQNDLLVKTNAELDRFVYSTSHDLRSPLSSILGLTNIAEKTSDLNEMRTLFTLIRGRVDKLDSFIKEIIDYSRNSRLELETEEFDLRKELEEAAEGLAHMPTPDQFKISIVCPSHFLITTDKKRLRVILNNLLGNAIKYCDKNKKNPHVTIHVLQKKHIVELRVEDNGIGIRPEHHSKIFNMFYRASDKSEGSGLGLYIVKETLSRIKGEISFESKYGEGSVFIVCLPVA
ncbi:MAG: PAS domain-containing sensor histidine kinase [Bacteroidetes bacterium]|nr:PAS domain-containing sensor histidine kinase [Bacteroidota bacterium]